jgi:cell division septal protein FtsQ
MRRRGNRRVRAQRRRRSALRVALIAVLWSGAAITLSTAAVLGARWAARPGNFALETITIRGIHEAREAELLDLMREWKGRNLFNISLKAVEGNLREHPWVGSTGIVRIRRSLPDGLVVTVRERTAAGLALVGGFVVLLDEHGAPIETFGPRHAAYDFPIITGVDRLVEGAKTGDRSRLREALLTGVSVTRTLAQRRPTLYDRISEINISDPSMVVLRLEDEAYDLRLSPEDCLRNLDNYFALKKRLDDAAGSIHYVDLRWQDRITVSPAAAMVQDDGGK